MMKPRLLIASLSKREAITNCILKNKIRVGKNFDLILLSELLTEYDIFDELCDSGTIIRWYKDGVKTISNESHHLLNRVTYIPKELFSNYINEDQDYAKREFEAYLGYAFNSFKGVGTKSVNGTCAEILSLPQQWKKVQNVAGMNIPNYYWGPQHANVLNKSEKIIYSHIYDFLNWSRTKNISSNENIFCFERPKGEPVFIFIIGEQFLITNPEHVANRKFEVIKIVKEINKAINLFIAEMLLFVDENKITFGCLNPEIVQSSNSKQFDDFVCEHLIKEYDKCLV